MIGLIVAWIISFFFAVLFRCGTQFWAYWNTLAALLAHCNSSTPNFQAFSISDVITDGIILLMPLYWVNTIDAPQISLVRRLTNIRSGNYICQLSKNSPSAEYF